MKELAKAILAIFFVLVGVYGMSRQIQYSGWLLFVGCLIGLSL